MDNSEIEASAVGSVHSKLNDTGFINVSDIKEGDKFPIWDGNILVYSSDKQKNNETIRYKIPIQIKGTEAKIEKSLKYNIRTNDLKKYCKDGGVLYFVVQVIRGHSENNKVFYIDLLPAKIKRILQNKEKNGKISIDIKNLPSSREELVNLIFNFGLNREKQADFIPIDKYTLADFKEICLHYETPFKTTPNDILLNFSGYAYGYKDNIPYPFEIPKGAISHTISAPLKISINETECFKNCELRKDINTLTLIINHNIEFIYNNENKNVKCNLLLQGTLRNYIESTKFLLEVHKYRHFYVNGYKQDCPFEKDDTSVLESNLKYYEELKKAFDESGVKEDIELHQFNENDNKNATILINAFVYNQDIALKTDAEGYVLDFHILDKTITCLAFRNKTGKYNFKRFPIEGIVTVEKNGNLLRVPSILMLKRQHLKNSINIQIDSFLDYIKKCPISPYYLDIVNETALELMAAYDDINKSSLLDTAENIINWIEDKNKDEKSAVVYHLNLLQCKIRKNKKLSNEDKDYLHTLVEENNAPILKYGAYILLQDKQGAERQFKKLGQDDQNNIKKFPIYKLWEQLNNNT
ncbi:MAG: hypothetical protein IJ529_01055 [Alphaproteobacteria bacterium]|nr:hypothetical protein [Alphaproteobacteria bacterium]MBQ9234881.1 hypothetical protein [Alphaproteobacteria bacterium]